MINTQRVFSSVTILTVLLLPLVVAKTASSSEVEIVTSPVAKTEIVELAPVVITVEPSEVKLASRPQRVAHTAPAREKVWTCGEWNSSAVGGGYRECKWL